MDKKELVKMTKKQLVELSKSMDIKGRHSLKKDELINAIMACNKKKPEKPSQESEKSASKSGKKVKKSAGGFKGGKKGKKEQGRDKTAGSAEIVDVVGSSKRRKYLGDLSEGEEENAIRQAKYDTGTSEQFNDIDEDVFLPTSYLKSRIHLLVKNPYEVFVYWDLVPDDINKAREEINGDISEVSVALRVYDVTMVDFKGDNANSYFDIYPDIANRYFIKVPKSNCYYCVEIGLKSREGYFVPVARSNTKKTPKDFVTYGLKWKKVDLHNIRKSKEILSRKDYIKPLISIDGQVLLFSEKERAMMDALKEIQNGQASEDVSKKSRKGSDGDYFGSSTMAEF